MVKHLQDLELTVLVALVLEHFLYRHVLPCLSNDRFEHNSEGTISNDLFGIVGEASLLMSKWRGYYRFLLGFARLVLDFHFVDLIVELLYHCPLGLLHSFCLFLHAG